MPATLEPIRPIKCTYPECIMSFSTEKAMKSHKKHSDEHDYCATCDEDFGSFDDYTMHKITRPENHNKACRVCGDEFKSEAGLKLHIELKHRVDQHLTCIGCKKSFCSATLFIEHLEFEKCDVISAEQFHGHIVHKHLVTELLKNNHAMARFQEKTAKFEAALDFEQEGGVSLTEDPLGDDDGLDEVTFTALKPHKTKDTPFFSGEYPPLPGQEKKKMTPSTYSITSTFDRLSIAGDSNASTVIEHAAVDAFPALNASSQSNASTEIHRFPSITDRPNVWGSCKGKLASSLLFPNAKATPKTREFAITTYDQNQQKSQGLNLMRDRFWDPLSTEFKAKNYYNTFECKFYCPFVCEQTFLAENDLSEHILGDHRFVRMKCPTCLKYFQSATALIAHCETRGAKCQINKAEDFNIILDRLSGGFLAVEEKIRPDHLKNPTIMRINPETGRLETYKPPVATYLEFSVTTPPDWKEPEHKKVQLDGPPRHCDASQW